jgi:drug/metabolite transporter (DMT)-like permease
VVRGDRGGASGILPFSLLGTSIFFWGSSYWPVEIAGPHTPSLMLAALRSAPAAVVLLAVLPLLGARLPRGRTAVWSALTGLLMVAVFFYGATEGTVRAGAGNASVLVNTAPFFVLILGRLFLGERVSWIRVGGLVAGFCGVVVMVSSQLGAGGDAVDLQVGFAVALSASVAWAVGTLAVKRLVAADPGLDLVGFTAIQYVAGGLLLAAIEFAVDGTGGTDWSAAALWGPIAYLVLGTSALASITYFAALKRLPATRTAAALFLVPLVAVLVEIGRGRSPSAVVLMGMALTIVGVALVNSTRKQLDSLAKTLSLARV